MYNLSRYFLVHSVISITSLCQIGSLERLCSEGGKGSFKNPYFLVDVRPHAMTAGMSIVPPEMEQG